MQIRDMLIGYARVSTDDQDLRVQRGALKGIARNPGLRERPGRLGTANHIGSQCEHDLPLASTAR